MKQRVLVWSLGLSLGLSALLALSGCQSKTGTGPDKTGATTTNVVTAVVPCGQIGPFSSIAKLWEKQNPGVKLDWQMGNMVTITEEVLSGQKKPDAFLSMGDLEVDRLEKAGLVEPGTRVQYAENALAITIPKQNAAGVEKIEDLTRPGVKAIGVPDPAKNSVGKHAIEALKGAGIYSKVEGKIAQTTYAADSKEMSEKGQVEATMAYLPCVTEVHVPGQPPAVPKGITVTLVPQNLYTPFSCEGAVIKGAANPEGGKKLLALLKSPEAQKLFKQWSFQRAPAAK